MDGTQPGDSNTHLTWVNVGLAFSFIVLDAVLSSTFGLRVGGSLVTAAVRCVIQLAVVGTLLQKVFETDNPWAVAGIAGESWRRSAFSDSEADERCRLVEFDGDVRDRFVDLVYLSLSI